ncbi:Protein of unknown function [Sedimentitalea nanhaiensis]|uniref:DUF1499 domain-containing protein n=1 Tax=Sedimentitalea nanhaiensis TaxID=999627 RepID=A0A1I7ANM0_9RHOB|nr:Protein of unknown function [Sedimentitalea nanhaiensis]
MGKLRVALWVVLAVVAVLLGYVRLAPSDPETWHVMPQTSGDKDFGNGVIRVVSGAPDGLERLDGIVMQSPRTTRLAGSTGAGMLTYVTRSALFGFPDYTTVQQDAETVTIYARARFGRSDMGVNRDRVQGWIDALQP